MALGLLIVIKLVAERDLLPEGDIFHVIIAALLAFLLVESNPHRSGVNPNLGRPLLDAQQITP